MIAQTNPPVTQAMDAALIFVQPKLIDISNEKGLIGLWCDAFRAGWHSATRQADQTVNHRKGCSEDGQLCSGFENDRGTRPTAHGFYWARQIAVDPGTRDEDEFEPSFKFEPVEVFENTLDETHPEHLRVSALGIERGQSLDNFEWGPFIAGPHVREVPAL